MKVWQRTIGLAALGCALSTAAWSAAPAVGDPAPAWGELNDLTGTPHRLEEWRGSWLLLKLGTTQCPNCALQLVELGKIRKDIESLGISVIDVYLHEDRYTVKKYWEKKTPESYRPFILYDYSSRVIQRYGLTIIPQLILVDREGVIRWKGWYTPAPDLLAVLEEHVSGVPNTDRP